MKNLFACLLLLSFSYKNFLLENSYCNVDMKKEIRSFVSPQKTWECYI